MLFVIVGVSIISAIITKMAPRINIVDPQVIMGEQEIVAERFCLREILQSLISPMDTFEWLATRRLLRNSVPCRECNSQMSLTRRERLTADKYNWQCRICKKTISVRDGSCFAKSHLTLLQIVIIIYGWSRNWSQENTALEAELGPGSTHAIVDWFKFCRVICETALENFPDEIGGFDENGEPKVVEIDESKFFHRKFHRGLWREGHWVFGGIERGSGKCFLVEVPDRRAETLGPLIQR